MEKKECFKCLRTLPMIDFYGHPNMKDGHLGKCKKCTRKDSDDRRRRLETSDPEWAEKEKARHRKKARDTVHRYPEKLSAHQAASSIKKVPGQHRHHWSYLEEHRKDIIMLHAYDHLLIHRNMVYDQERMQYRALSGILLDSRESHLEFALKLGVKEQ